VASEKAKTKILIGSFALLAGALAVWLLSRPAPVKPPDPLTPEAKAYVRSLSLSDVTMKANKSYMNQMVTEIEGKIENKGDRALEQVELHCSFYDGYGQLVLRERVAIVSQKMGGLAPGETKSFRLPFDTIPESWNRQMPSLVIASIRFR
jgi:hypothetical protein